MSPAHRLCFICLLQLVRSAAALGLAAALTAHSTCVVHVCATHRDMLLLTNCFLCEPQCGALWPPHTAVVRAASASVSDDTDQSGWQFSCVPTCCICTLSQPAAVEQFCYCMHPALCVSHTCSRTHGSQGGSRAGCLGHLIPPDSCQAPQGGHAHKVAILTCSHACTRMHALTLHMHSPHAGMSQTEDRCAFWLCSCLTDDFVPVGDSVARMLGICARGT